MLLALLVGAGYWWQSALARSLAVEIRVDEKRVRVKRRSLISILQPKSVPTRRVTTVLRKAGGRLAIVSHDTLIRLSQSSFAEEFGFSETDLLWLQKALTTTIANLGARGG